MSKIIFHIAVILALIFQGYSLVFRRFGATSSSRFIIADYYRTEPKSYVYYERIDSHITLFAAVSSSVTKSDSVMNTFANQKNQIIMSNFLKPHSNLTQVAMSMVNFCDEGFNQFLNEKISNAYDEEEKSQLGRIRYAMNSARQQKLIEADEILCDIIAPGELKKMEAKLYKHLSNYRIDMAFMVILQLNIEDAQKGNAEIAVQVLTHLRTLIIEHQDKFVSPQVRLLRMLIRTDDPNVRKQMLRQKLILRPSSNNNSTSSNSNDDSTQSQQQQQKPEESLPEATPSPQCEHILVQPVHAWGGADVHVKELEETLNDVYMQMCELGGSAESAIDMEEKCNLLRQEIHEVMEEYVSRRLQYMDDAATAEGSSCSSSRAVVGGSIEGHDHSHSHSHDHVEHTSHHHQEPMEDKGPTPAS